MKQAKFFLIKIKGRMNFGTLVLSLNLEQTKVEIQSGILISLRNDDGEALIEIKDPNVDLRVMGERVVEIGVLKPYQWFSVGEQQEEVYAYLSENDAMVNPFPVANTSVAAQFKENQVLFPLYSDSSFTQRERIYFYCFALLLISVLIFLVFLGPEKFSQTPESKHDFVFSEYIKPQNVKKTVSIDGSKLEQKSNSANSEARVKTSPKSIRKRLKKDQVDDLKKQRVLFQEYLLEARFDPRSANRKIRELEKKVPHHSELKLKITRYLSGVPM